ncbi:MAG: serine/threonine protein kinase [Deltaproteobacteria bacterium]|nr:serine/threonine protein kinase [Deltaproteobacteria bacterium]
MADAGKTWQPGDLIADKYELQRPLASGGMGQVWEAKNQLTERRVAIKFMLPELATSPDTVQRFFREAKASARIDHPSIVDVLDLGTLEDNAPFMVMEYLDGRSLEQIIDREPLVPIQIAAVMLDVTHALAAAHAAGIVHRDLKPANILVAKRGEQLLPKILDFGISKITSSIGGDVRMTRTGAVLGSPAYMSPEQAAGRTDIDGRADIWAVGVILYEAVSGKLPFTGENYNQMMMAISLDPPKPLATVAPAVDDDFVAIVDACLQKDRDQRPPSMDSLAALLDAYVAPRAAYGIPPIDVGADRPRKPTSARLGAYAIPRAIPSKPPAEKDTVVSGRAQDPAQVTVGGAVTVVDPPKHRARRNAAAMAGVTALLLVGAGVGVWSTQRDRARPAASVSEVPPAATAQPASAATSATPAPSAATSPEPSSSAAASSAASTEPVPSASASAKPKPSISAPVPFKPKPKPTDDGPANVGAGPGF